jgi:hypothetical protein
MSQDHLTVEALRRLLEKDNDEDQNRLLLHHLEVCPGCREVGGHVADLYRSGAIDLHFSVVDVDLALSRSQAPGLWEALRGLTPEERSALVLASDRFTTWGMAELLCDQSLAAADEDPGRAVELAGLAVWISLNLPDWQPAEEAWTIELRAYALAHLGHAWKRRRDPVQAANAFEMADRLWESVVGDMGDVLGYESRVQELVGEDGEDDEPAGKGD